MLLAELNKQIETWFHCVMGPATAYFEIPTNSEVGTLRFVYQMIGFQMTCQAKVPDDLREAQEKLLQRMYREFETAYKSFELPDDPNQIRYQPIVFWRRKLEFLMENGHARLSCRLVIPGYQFPRSATPDEGSWEWPPP